MATNNRSQVNVAPENSCMKFLMQFTLEEQATLMAWVERLVAEGRIEMDSTHPLFEAFEALKRIHQQQIDTLPLAVSRRPVDERANEL